MDPIERATFDGRGVPATAPFNPFRARRVAQRAPTWVERDVLALSWNRTKNAGIRVRFQRRKG